MAEPINMVELVAELPRRRRGRACIILTGEASEQKEWARKLADLTGANHLDLLDRFAEDDTLGSGVGTFGVPHLFSMLQGLEDKPVVVVAGLEFLFASWSGRPSAMEDLAARVEFWDKSPAIVFVTQYDTFLARRKFDRRFQYDYVVDQRDTLAL